MSGEIYNLEVVISAYDRALAPLKAVSAQLTATSKQYAVMQKAMKAAGATSSELGALQQRMDALARSDAFSKMAPQLKSVGAQTYQIEQLANGLNKLATARDKIASGQSLLAKGGMAIAGGLAIGASLIEPIKNAMDLQKSMMQVQIASGANPNQVKQLTANAMLGSLDTGISSVMVAQVQQALAQSRLPLANILSKNTFDQYLKFADLMYQRNGTPVSESSASAVQMSHEYQLYKDPQKLSSFLNQLWQTLAVTHTSVQSFGNIFSYYAGQANRLGISPNSAMNMESFLISSGLAGNGRSGGSDIDNFLQRSSSPASKAALAAMKQTGLMGKNGESIFFGANGNFVGLPQQIAIMQQWSKQFKGNKAQEINAAKVIWGAQGERYALALSGPSAPGMNTQLQKQIGAVPGVEKSQAMQMNTISGQLSRLKMGWQDMMTGLGMPQLASAMNFLKSINDMVSKIVQFEIAHPLFMKSVGNLIKLSAAALAFRGVLMGVAGTAKIFSGAFHLTKLFGDLTKTASGARTLTGDFGLVGGTMKTAVSLFRDLGSWLGRITGLTRVFTTVMRVASLVMRMNPVGLLITGLTLLGVAIYELIKHWSSVCSWLSRVWSWFDKVTGVGKAFGAVAKTIMSLWSPVAAFFDNIWKHISPVISGIGHLLGIGGSIASPTASIPTSSMSTSTTVHINAGAITVSGVSDPHAAAKSVLDQLGNHYSLQNWSSPSGPNKLAFGH
ncbi:phage tail tape measure protein [Alicyclobacillus dauci]|uniref:Phage tail tape measure protein, TP901 family, core region n=1 Tax=Alicyclobacillus dauci TaxID=1475485 RepID=A0ABY6Z9I5_9BACL|nr:hypothetical protein [Alicyclobacillus dauci]WAH39474.1 hypothetical protein NZD86_24195 [Alicyclobacillus dauci]WAH39534.1 hypothetical protein NZD86_23895 [Alicyclobacillus dauci]